ncbi:hypothetical protein ACFV2N_47610 [Streptomyces sp. NPDC059680]|uniref:hypothetical protein n=1 Tax=Streptomyces sp. NPDC059680 TaxID=3346904 RepID=UPI0036AF3A94
MSNTPGLDNYRAQHEEDIITYREFLDTLKQVIRTGLSAIEGNARQIADLIPQAEEDQQSLRLKGDSISAYARLHGQAGVTTPDQLGEFLAGLSPAERAVYDEARLGAAQAARALGRHAQP